MIVQSAAPSKMWRNDLLLQGNDPLQGHARFQIAQVPTTAQVIVIDPNALGCVVDDVLHICSNHILYATHCREVRKCRRRVTQTSVPIILDTCVLQRLIILDTYI